MTNVSVTSTMASSEICLRWVAVRPLFQNPYRHRIPSADRIYGLRLYATSPQPKSGLVPRQRQSIPNQNPAGPKHNRPPPKLNPFVSSNAPNHNNYVAPNPTKSKPLVQLKPGGGSFGPIAAPTPRSESKSKGRVYLPRTRVVIGVLLVGSILYSMVVF